MRHICRNRKCRRYVRPFALRCLICGVWRLPLYLLMLGLAALIALGFVLILYL